MKYYLLHPDVAGEFGDKTVLDATTHPPLVHSLHFKFEGWDGDDIVGCFPVVLVTKRLADVLISENIRGCTFETAKITKGEYFKSSEPNNVFPQFLWMKVTGEAGKDQVGLDKYGRLVVSEEVLKILRSFVLKDCEITAFESASDPKEHLRLLLQAAREDVQKRYPRP